MQILSTIMLHAAMSLKGDVRWAENYLTLIGL